VIVFFLLMHSSNSSRQIFCPASSLIILFHAAKLNPTFLSKARLIDRVFAATISAAVGRHCVSAASAATVKTFKECASTNSLMRPVHT
jgi:hypothetical protein